MADSLPTPQSYDQILGAELSAYASKIGVNDLNTMSANTSFFEVAALIAARSSGDIFAILRDFNLSRATGPALKRLGTEYLVPPITARVTTGYVNVIDSTFQKISTKIYAGLNPPIAGSTTVYVSDASLFPATGSIYIGRGSVNIEGPIAYSSKTPVGSYWSLSLSSATTKFHNISESVILSQGGVRTVPVNTVVVSPGVGSSADIKFITTQVGTILDGEVIVSNIPVTAMTPGSAGNVSASSITSFAGLPFSGATVTNPLAFTTGKDTETDDQYRVRIQNKLASTGLGTVLSIESALQGVQDPGSSATIVSTDILNSSSNTIVFIDNGAGYEGTTQGTSIESIVDLALGGEKFFQLVTGGKQTSVAKAFLVSVASAPFDLSGGEVLAVTVGNVTYEHTFASTDFANPGSATGYEVSASLNANTTLGYESVTLGNGSFVKIRPSSETENTMQMTVPSSNTVTDANIALEFPSAKAETLRLYKNGNLLTEDGSTASIFTFPQGLWSPTLVTGETLSISVDGTQPITYTFTDAEFVAEGTYQTLSSSNSLESWANVFNTAITGITATVVGSTIELTSNLGAVNRAKITVLNTGSFPTSLIGKGVISINDLSSIGVKSDYILDRNTAQIQLSEALIKDDKLSAGTAITQATIKGGLVVSGSVALSSDAHVWLAIDVDAISIPTILSGSFLSVSKPYANVVRYTSSSTSAFSNVVPGDYVIVWSTEIDATARLEGRVHSVSGAILDIEVTSAEYAAVVTVTNATYVQGFVVVRTAYVPQKFRVQSGTKTLDVIANELQTQTDSLSFSVFNNTNLVVTSNSDDPSGQITVVTADSFGVQLGFIQGTNGISQDPLVAFYDSNASTSELPLFFHSTISADAYASPIDTYLTNFSSTDSLSNFDPNELIAFLNPYSIQPTASGTLTKVSGTGDATITFSAFAESATPNQYTFTVTSANVTAGSVYSNNTQFFTVSTTIVAGTTLITLSAGLIDDEQPANESVQMSDISGTAVTVLPEYPNLRRLRTTDRYFVANPLDFGYNDTAVIIVDNDSVGETYTLPLYRRAIANSTYASNNFSFNAYDVDSGATSPFSANFTGFDFSNFKALMQAKKVIKETSPQTALLYRSTLWGRSGEKINVAYTYPTSANKPIDSVVTVTDVVSIRISLKSDTPITMSIDGTTQWDVTITPNTPSAGIDQATYTYSGTGTAPGLTLSGGEYVTILTTTGFDPANTGTFRVSTELGFTPTATSFSVQVPTGSAVVQSGIPTTVPNGISFYNSSATTAAEVNTYVNANLSQYVTTTIINDGGSTGSGILALSTYEDNGFTAESYYLLDGINWISTSNVTGSPQFTFKRPLALDTDTGYSFNDGDEVRLIPTTMGQVQKLLSILAVTGFTTVGSVLTVDRGTKLQFASNILGSTGAVQIVGGSGNEYSVPVLTSGQLVTNSTMEVIADSIASQSMASDQWFRLQALNFQSKNTGIDSNTSVTALNNYPIAGETTVSLLNGTLTQRYFGRPRHHIRVKNDTFRIEKQGSLVCLSWNGSGTSPSFSTSLNFNDSSGWTLNVSPGGTYTVATGNTNFTAMSIGDLITITGCINPENNGIFFVEGVSANGKVFSVGNNNAVTETGTAITAGEFSCSSSVSEGDTIILSSSFAPLNQGEYRIIRRQNNSVWFENSNAVEEEVFCAPNTISTGYGAGTTFTVFVDNNYQKLVYTGTGTAPTLGDAQTGDIATFGSGFSSANQGQFMVTDSGPAQGQVVKLTFTSGSSLSASGPGDYFKIYNGAGTGYYVWYNVASGNTDPAVVGFTGIQVAVGTSDTDSTIASKTYLAINGTIVSTTFVLLTNTVTATTIVPTVSPYTTNPPSNGTMPIGFSAIVTVFGQQTFLTVINPSVVSDVGVSSVTLSVNRPQIQFYEYEASVPGDKLIVNGTVLGAGNAGSYKILRVLNKTTAILIGNISQQYNTNIAGNQQSLSVEEGTAYTGYKQVLLVSSQPGTINFNNIVFNTSAQFDKISLSANTAMVSLGKLNFPTTVKVGLDSYNYDTGLIGEANRVIYGDPRDSVTYSGVNAAGTDIFLREPLLLRVKIALSIRTNIGVSFAQITSQIQSSVFSLVLSNPLGKSLDLSSIVETVRSIPGVTSVVLTNPLYSTANDEIKLVTGQKAFINSLSDISVSLLT